MKYFLILIAIILIACNTDELDQKAKTIDSLNDVIVRLQIKSDYDSTHINELERKLSEYEKTQN